MSAPASRAAPAEGSCVECHRTLPDPGGAHSFADWERSVHARNKVSCHSCHMGNPGAKDKKSAHDGVQAPSDPSSPVFFTKIPETCGACHQRALKGFTQSPHQLELAKTGRVPNCVTCHGPLADHNPAPRELELTCAICHRAPTGASKALGVIAEMRTGVKRLSKQRAASKRGSPDLDWELAGAMEKQQNAVARWHALDMVGVAEAAEKTKRR